METIIKYLCIAILAFTFLCNFVIGVLKFCNLDKTQRDGQIRGWLLQAVLLAEREYGSGTGKLKLSSVYDKFCECCPWLARTISFERFNYYVDETLIEMKAILESNTAIASIVAKEEKS